MINYKLGYGVVLSLVVGLSGCYMDGTRSAQGMDYPSQGTVHNNKNVEVSKQKVASKSTSSVEPKQATTPGPKRAAAPQLPVIQ